MGVKKAKVDIIGKKEQMSKEYCDKISYEANKYELSQEAFKAGWMAALDYFSSLPFDTMMEEFEAYFEEREETK